MKQQGNCIIGDPIRVDDFTSNWNVISMHPSTFYRRYEEICENLQKTKGFYTKLDIGNYVLIKFSEKEDLDLFYKNSYEYI